MKSWTYSVRRIHDQIDAGEMPHLHDDMRENINAFKEDIKIYQACIVCREMQVTPLVSPILPPLYVKPFLKGDSSSWVGTVEHKGMDQPSVPIHMRRFPDDIRGESVSRARACENGCEVIGFGF